MPLKNMNDIRAMLCEEIENLRAEKTTPANVNAIVNATGKILSTIKMELEFARLTNKHPKNSFIQLEDVKIEGDTKKKQLPATKTPQNAPT